VARAKVSKSPEHKPTKVRLTLTIDPDTARRHRVAAADLGISESVLFERVVAKLFGGVHARNVDRSWADEQSGQGRGGVETPQPMRVLNERRAFAVDDQALDDLVNESGDRVAG